MNSEMDKNCLIERLKLLMGDEKPFPWAQRIGLSQATFNRIWKEGVPPKGETLLLISRATGCSIDWLLTGEGLMMRDKLTNHANGNGIVQGRSIDVEEIHIDVNTGSAVHEAPMKYGDRDPLDDAFLKDWHRLSEVGMMRFWTLLKEEIEKET